jgi:hypothetical protein
MVEKPDFVAVTIIPKCLGQRHQVIIDLALELAQAEKLLPFAGEKFPTAPTPRIA